MLVSNKAWCKKHADKLGVGYKSEHSGPCGSVCLLLSFLFADTLKMYRHREAVFELLLDCCVLLSSANTRVLLKVMWQPSSQNTPLERHPSATTH